MYCALTISSGFPWHLNLNVTTGLPIQSSDLRRNSGRPENRAELPRSAVDSDFGHTLARIIATLGANVDPRPALGSGDDIGELLKSRRAGGICAKRQAKKTRSRDLTPLKVGADRKSALLR